MKRMTIQFSREMFSALNKCYDLTLFQDANLDQATSLKPNNGIVSLFSSAML